MKASDTNISQWLSVIVASVGVIVTIVYVTLTYRLLRVSERSGQTAARAADAAREGAVASLEAARESHVQRRISTEPLLAIESGDTGWYGDMLVSMSLRVRNYGDGPAFGIRAEVAIPGKTAEQKEPAGPLLARAGLEVRFDQGRMNWPVGPRASITITLRCFDVLGSEHVWTQQGVLENGTAVIQVLSWPQVRDGTEPM